MNALESFRRREGALTSVTEAMAATPLVALDRLTAGVDGRILAKLDYLLPGFSKKDRAALRIVENAEQEGELTLGQTVVELTSGNMGTGLAIVCGVKGYPFVAVMSRGNSAERARMMQALGAEVVLVDQAPGSRPGEVSGTDLALVEEAAQRITVKRGAFRADQFQRPGNPESHRDGTGPEIWLQSGGQLDAFCDFAGSAGTLAGCATFFRETAPAVKCYAVEPEGAEALAGSEVTKPDHPIQGGGYSMPELAHLNDVALDGYLTVSGEEARDFTRRLAREEGIFAGFSAGANVAAAFSLLEGPHRGGTVAVIICDSGLKYLSTDLWMDDTP